ncbi:MAG TPA: M1 family aminopeptidase, partial [Thermoanaerobaculia bacterium]|nr:M1 family aminopeptidase [Thermoanaerobaculia bacterium]
PVYEAFRSARPSAEGIAVRNLVLERDAFRLSFDGGAFYMLPVVAGRTPGAVFVGKGTWSLTPRSGRERRHLAVVIGEPDLKSLSDRFEKIVLLFTDRTGDEIQAAGEGRAPADPRAAGTFDRFLKAEHKDIRSNLHLRLLGDLVEGVPAARGTFLAWVEGDRFPPAILQIDPRGVPFAGARSDEVALLVYDEMKGGAWYLDRPAGPGPAAVPPVRAEGYKIDVRIRKNAELQGTTDLLLRVKRDGVRVVDLDLFPKLRVREASFGLGPAPEPAAFRPVAVVQEDAREDGQTAVVFPEALVSGAVLTLRLSYEGEDVLADAGSGNYYVGARQSWYPNVGSFAEPAPFDITYRIPKKNEIVSVGRIVSKQPEGDFVVVHAVTDAPIRVAGFNYGRFKMIERRDDDSGVTVRVYTNPDKPDFARELEAVAEIARFDTERLAQSAMVDGINTLRTGKVFFGNMPTDSLAITQQAQWNFGQSWPSLVYLPYLAFLTSTTRASLGIFGVTDFVDQVGPHEVAHQWFGHHVGWATYHDEWLSEGFAEFTAALVLQQTEGYGRYLDALDKARHNLFSTGRGEKTTYADVGPISLGRRLSDGRHAGAYAAVVYEKGAWVLHMLRILMRERTATPDARFIEMMHDWVGTWAGKNPSTEDFQRVVEKHMAPAMDLRHDGKMDWFFDQWVRGTEIPKLTSRIDFRPDGEGRYRLSGEVTQSGVAPGFLSPAALYVEFDKGEVVRLGTMTLNGPTTIPVDGQVSFPKKPKRIILNAYRDVLSRD